MEEKDKTIDEVAKQVNNQKDNKAFLLLSVFGIIFVVLGHGAKINVFLNNVFPYYSFHMALFAFISGYFFKDRKTIEFLRTKIKKLIIPYFIWNIIYGIIVNVLKYFNIIHYGKEMSLFNVFVAPFYGDGIQFCFNLAAWFVITIFFVQIIYFFINKLNRKIKVNTEISVMIISIIIAYFELELVKKGYNRGFWFLITRVSFLMPFYAIGQVYKRFEKYEIQNNILYFGTIILIQTVLLQKWNLTYNLNILVFNSNFIIYLLASITGIMFWLRISKIFSKFIGDNKLVKEIGNNTYSIMMHHIFIYFLINTGILVANKLVGVFSNFDYNSYQNNVWYFYNEKNAGLLLIYVILAIMIPIVMKKIFIRVKEKVKLMILRSNL